MSKAARLRLHPISIQNAKVFIKRHHRHHRPPRSGLFALACTAEGSEEPCGVILIGRPVARHLDDGWVTEVTRCCTDGTKNACSFLYGAAWRAAKALGYRKMITYTLPSEGGSSLRGAGWSVVGESLGGSWSTEARPRVDLHPLQNKFRWEAPTQ